MPQAEKARIASATIDDELAADPKLAEQASVGAGSWCRCFILLLCLSSPGRHSPPVASPRSLSGWDTRTSREKWQRLRCHGEVGRRCPPLPRPPPQVDKEVADNHFLVS